MPYTHPILPPKSKGHQLSTVVCSSLSAARRENHCCQPPRLGWNRKQAMRILSTWSHADSLNKVQPWELLCVMQVVTMKAGMATGLPPHGHRLVVVKCTLGVTLTRPIMCENRHWLLQKDHAAPLSWIISTRSHSSLLLGPGRFWGHSPLPYDLLVRSSLQCCVSPFNQSWCTWQKP